MTNITDLINKQIPLLENLAQLLEQELRLISSRDPEALMNLVSKKDEVLDTISTQDDHIKQFMLKNQITTLTPEQQEQIEKIYNLVSECQYRTKINETAVEQGQLRLEHLRSLLLESRAKEGVTYNKSGKPQGSASGKSIKA